MKVAVVGLGGVGSAAAYHLARDGHRVVGVEQFAIDHDRGESYGGSRIIRRVYSDPFYTRLMDESYRLWDAFQAEAREELLVRCGGIFFGQPEDPEQHAFETALIAAEVPFERWSAEEARRRYPQFRFQPEEIALYQADTGFLRASRCVRAAARLARDAGAELREETALAGIEGGPDGVRLRLARGETLLVDRAVVCAGPWTGRLLAERGIRVPLVVTRQQYVHLLAAPGDTRFRIGSFPVWYNSGGHGMYGFPEEETIPGVKIADHHLGEVVDPDHVNRAVDDACREAIRAYARRVLPDLTSEISYEKVCLYDNTPNEDFILDRLPDEPRVMVIGGTSGHGFKFVALLGRLAASLAADREPSCDPGRFALSRFTAAGAAG
jgi:monomeric sarcosine oxidase